METANLHERKVNNLALPVDTETERNPFRFPLALPSNQQLTSGELPFVANLSTPDPVSVELTKGYSALIDADDAEQVLHFKWCATVKSNGVYAVRSKCYGWPRYLHQFIMGCPWIDHEDGDGLNCTRRNLRPCTSQQNGWNRRKKASSTQPYKGVEARGGVWSAYIYREGRRVRLGTFPTPELAASAHDAAAKKLHEEFAYLNLPVTQAETWELINLRLDSWNERHGRTAQVPGERS